MNFRDKTVRIFNKLFSSLLKDLKEVDESLRHIVKAEYKVIDKTSDEHCNFFRENIFSSFEKLKNEDLDAEVNERLICRGISLSNVLKYIDDDDVDTRAIVMNYVYTLTLFAYLYGMDITDEEGDILLNQVIEVLGQIQHDDSSTEIDSDILDDDVNTLLNVIKKYPASVPGSASQPSDANDDTLDPASIFASLGDSKIANIAKEISKDIDTSKLKADNPDELIKNMFDFSGGNNILGNIVQKVSTTLNDKISSGELNHEELLGEAMSMMNLFGGKGGNAGMAGMLNNPLFSQMMKGMKSGKAGVRQDVISKASTRDRLKKKLESRNKNKNVE
jgi:hypothetical protein